jgi:hypothetical protein
MKWDFGYCPERIDIEQGDLLIETLPNFEESVSDVKANKNIHADWLYPGNYKTVDFNRQITEHPYNFRVFGLPKTHSIEHKSSDNI